MNECFTVGAFEVKFDVSAIKGARPSMEDRWAVARHPDANEPYVLFAVFDGHGGDAVSSFLAARFSETLFERASNDDETDETGAGRITPAALLRRDPSEALRRACLACDEEIVARFPKPAGFRSGPGPGSTAVVALFALTETNPRAFVACVGDSRCVAADQHGTVVFETVDQRPNRAEERARVERARGTVRVVGGVARAAGVLAVSRAFGNAGIKACVKADPEVSTLALESVDSGLSGPSGPKDGATTRPPSDVHTVILCSDGLTDVVASDRAAEAHGVPAVAGARASARARRRERKRHELERVHAYPASIRSARRSGGLRGGPRRVPAAAGPDAGGAAWWGSRRVAAALTSLAKMRQSADNVCVLVCARAPLGNEPVGAGGGGGRPGDEENHAGQDAGRDDAGRSPGENPGEDAGQDAFEVPFEDAFEVAFEVAGEDAAAHARLGSRTRRRLRGGRGARKPRRGDARRKTRRRAVGVVTRHPADDAALRDETLSTHVRDARGAK